MKKILSFAFIFFLISGINAQMKTGEAITLKADLKIDKDFKINKYIHSVFAEVLGDCVYDGIWVGKDSEIPNVDGIRKDFIDGCIEAGVTAIRWPGGVYADHYHWKYGIGPDRKNRMSSAAAVDMETSELTRVNMKGNEFGTDEFIRLCKLINASPVIVANTATGTPADLLDWFEYCNGDSTTFWGAKRAAYGNPEPYNVTIWALGNTDDNAWHIAYQDPLNYARDFLRYRTAIRHYKGIQVIGLGYSLRHNEPGWAGEFLNYVTRGGKAPGPNSISVHHYSGGGKSATSNCGPGIDFTDEQYYYSLNTIELYERDIEHHRAAIKNHTNPQYKTTISFDEWGFWHPDGKGGLRQSQPLRDGLFAALSLHTFYRNCDVVEYAMATQVINVLQSLFESDGEKFYKTPTFYVFKLFKSHRDQYLLPLTGMEEDAMLDCVMSSTEDGERITLSIINKHLTKEKTVRIPDWIVNEYNITESQSLTSLNVRDENTFDNPVKIKIHEIELNRDKSFTVGKHSVNVAVFEKISK